MRDDGIRYENYCCKYLQEKGYTTKTTAASGDQGADIIAQKDGFKIAVQCKYRTEGSVGNEAIQQALAGKAFYDCDLALVITNVDFTAKAIEAARKLKVKIWPNVRMMARNYDSSNDNSEENYDIEEMEYESVGPFIFGVSEVFAELQELIDYGRTLINSRFEIPCRAFYEDEEFELKPNKYINEYEEEYSKGKGLALRFHSLLEELSKYKFRVVDWYFSEKRDKRIFVYETSEIITPKSFIPIRTELNRLFGVEIDLNCVSDYSVIISIVNWDKKKSDNVDALLSLIVTYINQNRTRSIISTDLNEPLLEYEQLSEYEFSNDDKENINDYGDFYLFNCNEYIEDSLLLSLEKCISSFFKRKVLIRKKDTHSFVLCIRKAIGLNDYLTYINVHNFRGYDFSRVFSMTVGKCDDQIVFTVKLKNVDVSRYDDLLKDNKSLATLTANLVLIRYYVLGLFELTMIEQVKGKIIELPGTIRYKKFYSQGIKIQGIKIKVIDTFNRVIYIDHADMRTVNCLSSFPLKCLRHENYIGCDYIRPNGNIGLNAMLIQKFLQEQPEIAELYGSYYIIDTLKRLVSEYDSILYKFVPVFSRAYMNLQLYQCDDENVFDNENAFNRRLYYGVKPEEADAFHKNEYEKNYDFNRNYYYWMISSCVKNRNLLWGDPEPNEQPQDNLKVKTYIENFLIEKGIKFNSVDSSIENYFCYKIYGKEDIAALEPELNEKISVGGSILICKREPSKYVFVWDSYGDTAYRTAHLPLQELKKKKGGKPLQFWMLDLEIRPYCEFQSFFGDGFYEKIALLAIRLKNVSISDLENRNKKESKARELLWVAWNDILFSLVSLIQLSEVINEVKESYNLSEGLELYDSNNILIARIYSDSIRYSYFHYFSPISDEAWDMTFNDLFIEKHMPAIDRYSNDVLPKLNATLIRSLKILEELSE